MKSKKIKFYIFSILIKIVILIFITAAISSFLTSGLITNDIAIDQMENSDEAYVNLQMYNNMAPIVEIVRFAAIVIVGCAILYDVKKIFEIINDNDLI